MINKPLDVLEHFEIRKTKKQKTAFIQAVTDFAQQHGYTTTVEKGTFGCRNLIFGDPEKADYLVTAHYDTPASIGLPNFITPCNPVIFILSQILILIPFFAVSFIVAFLVGLMTNDNMLIYWAFYLTYMGMLYLLMFGPANRHNANDNTSGVVTVLETMSALPESLRDKVCFVLFDLEEAGLVGSSAYRKSHRMATDRQIVLNLDCVGDGDHIVLFPNRKVLKDKNKLASVEQLVRTDNGKTIQLHKKGFAYCPSDHKHFPYGIGIMAFHRAKLLGLYCDRIHTWRDKVLQTENVCILRAALIEMFTAAEKKKGDIL